MTRPHDYGDVLRVLPGADRPEDALKRLNVALGSDPPPKAIVLAIVAADGTVDTYVYGSAMRQEVLWAGAVLTDEALNG